MNYSSVFTRLYIYIYSHAPIPSIKISQNHAMRVYTSYKPAMENPEKKYIYMVILMIVIYICGLQTMGNSELYLKTCSRKELYICITVFIFEVRSENESLSRVKV